MKLRKRLAAVLLSAVMILTGLTACDGTTPAGPAELTWQNSRTKQYFGCKGYYGAGVHPDGGYDGQWTEGGAEICDQG